ALGPVLCGAGIVGEAEAALQWPALAGRALCARCSAVLGICWRAAHGLRLSRCTCRPSATSQLLSRLMRAIDASPFARSGHVSAGSAKLPACGVAWRG